MRVRSTWLAIAASVGFFFSSDGAQAGGDGYAPISNYNWSGIYLGLHAGGAWSQLDYNFLNEPFDQDASSFLLGGHIGLQRQWGNWVAGIEVSYSGLDLEETSPSPLQANRSNRIGFDDLWMATLRLGWAWDRSLLYIKGGYASAELGIERLRTSDGFLFNRSSEREHGWTIGTGWEFALMPNVVLGLEYNFVSLDADDRLQTIVSGTCGGGGGCRVTDIDADLHTVMARISFKTDHAIERAAPLK